MGVTFAQCGVPKWQRLPDAGAEALKPPPRFGHSNTARVGNNFKHASKVAPERIKKNGMILQCGFTEL